MSRGVLLVLAGPSGVGKGTIGKRLLERTPGLVWSVSWATRARRPAEVDGVDYHFVTRDEFEAKRAEGGFLESFEVYGDLKGTPRDFVVEHLDAGHDVLLEVDVQGALAAKTALPDDALLVWVEPPSREAQVERLRRRGADTPEAMARRLAEAEQEEAVARERFDHFVVNDDLERAVGEVAAILEGRRAARAQR